MVMKAETIAERADAYKIPGVRVDGKDVLAVYDAAQEAAARARRGGGPTLLELVTYRITGHSRRDPALYQPEEERKAAKAGEPLVRFKRYLLERRKADEAELQRILAEVDAEIEAAVQAAMAAPQPAPEDALQDVFAERGAGAR
jgi:TPP-dependent pyruvate/acetoin dehydrogenase alpha subunit